MFQLFAPWLWYCFNSSPPNCASERLFNSQRVSSGEVAPREGSAVLRVRFILLQSMPVLLYTWALYRNVMGPVLFIATRS